MPSYALPDARLLRVSLLLLALLTHTILSDVSLARLFAPGAPDPFGPLECRPLAPAPGAVAHWPLTAAPHELPPANPAGIVGVWRAEHCAGDARRLLPADMQRPPDAYVERVPPGTRVRCVGACRGALVIERIAGCPVAAACRSGRARPSECVGPAFAEPPPRSTVEDAWDLGPDELTVFLEGPEFLKLRGVHVGACRYVFSFDATLPGAYRAFALALRADWQALNETGAATTILPFPVGVEGFEWPADDDGEGVRASLRKGDGAGAFSRRLHHDPGHHWELSRFPPYTLDNILGDKLLMHLGVLRSDGASSADAVEAARLEVLSDASACNSLPPCDEVAPPGRWVRKTPTAGDFDADAPTWIDPGRRFTAPGSGLGIGYFSRIPESLAWTPYACCARPLHAGRVAACLSNTSTVLRGDSQVRDAFNTFLETACGNRERIITHGDDLCTHTEERCPGWRACYRWDAFGEALPANHSEPMCLQPGYAPNSGHYHDPACSTPAWVVPPGPEVAIVNFGQWSSSGGSQNSLALWALEVKRYAGMAARARSPRVFWLELAPFPQGNWPFFYKYRDWRTTHRMQLYQATAARAFERLAAQGRIGGVIPRYDVFDPVADATASDGAHASHPGALRELAERMVVAICGAGVREREREGEA